MNKDSLSKNNKGVSLVEIIIVVAIMTIIGATVVLSTRVATDKHVNSCALKLASSIEQTRNLALGKQGASVRIWQNTNDYVYLQMYVNGSAYGDQVAIGRPGITINVVQGGSPAVVGPAPIEINFSRSNGSVTDAAPVSLLSVTNGRRVYDVKIDKFTGRVTSELKTA